MGDFESRMLLTIREVLFSGDTNRLVAELTRVRVDDLAAPPPQTDFLSMLEVPIGIVIILNGAMLGLQADWEIEGWTGWFWFEQAFTLIFLAEMFARIRYSGCRAHFTGHDWCWNGFDAFVVFFAVVETIAHVLALVADIDTYSFTLIRLLRLTRLARLLRIFRLHFLKELSLMIKGFLGGIRTLLWAVVLLFFAIYIIAVLATSTVGRARLEPVIDKEELFSSVPRSMFTAFRCFVGDCTTLQGRPITLLLAQVYGWSYVMGYLAAMMLVTFGISNLIVSIYVENTMNAAKTMDAKDKSQRERESLRIAHLTKKVLKRFTALHRACSGVIRIHSLHSETDQEDIDLEMHVSKELFLLIVQDEEMQRLLDELDIPPDRADLFDIVDADHSGDLQVSELVQGILKVRGEARKSDVVASLLAVRAAQDMIRQLEETVHQNSLALETITGALKHRGLVSGSARSI